MNLVFADATDTCLLHCLANLVACAIGTQEQAKSSHLWYLVFASEKLEGTYFAGCMVRTLFTYIAVLLSNMHKTIMTFYCDYALVFIE